MSYEADRRWSDQFIPEIKRLVGPHLLEPAPFALDAKQATDLMVFTARDMRIAARLRRQGYAEKYPYDFTIRSQRDSGAETELSKIVNGWGDWLFYGHEQGDMIGRWWLISLHAFRAALIRARATISMQQRANGDGTYFTVFDLRTFPASPSILVAGSHDLPARAAA